MRERERVCVPVSHPPDEPTGAFYVKGPVTGYGGIASGLKVLKDGSASVPKNGQISQPAHWVAGELNRSLSRSSTRNLEYGGRRCGFNTKHQSTKAPRPQAD